MLAVVSKSKRTCYEDDLASEIGSIPSWVERGREGTLVPIFKPDVVHVAAGGGNDGNRRLAVQVMLYTIPF